MDSRGPETVGQWWDACHGGGHPRAGFYLTGHKGPEVWEMLGVKDLLVPGIRVLNIGVGEGHCTRALARLGCKVDALDISRAALDKVRDCVAAAYLAPALEELPGSTYDLALSFLVAQHMNSNDLERQIEAVVRALKPGGLFAMQFAFRLDPGAPPDPEDPWNCKEGGICRASSVVEEMVSRAGGRTSPSRVIGRFPEYGSGWAAVHISRPGEAR